MCPTKSRKSLSLLGILITYTLNQCGPLLVWLHLKKIQRINLNMSLVLGGRQEEGPGNKGIKYEKQAQKWNEDLEEVEEGEGEDK